MSEKEFGEIYLIKNFTNGLKYIGQTIQSSQERFSQHIRESKAKNRKEYHYPISRAIREYGEEAFDYGILAEKVPIEDLDLIEAHYIDMYDTTNPKVGYNVSIGHNDTSNFNKYKKKEENHIEEITDDDVNRILNEL